MIQGNLRQAQSETLFWDVVKKQDLFAAKGHIQKADKQTADLLREVASHFVKRLTLDMAESHAMNKLLQVVQNYNKWSPEMVRNTVFKAADMLKIKLPSAHF
jgi:hypothetical protein